MLVLLDCCHAQGITDQDLDIPFDENLVVLDVRKPAEYAEGHLKDAVNMPLNDMTDPGTMANIRDDQNVYVHCAGGYRSVIASSLLKRQGFHNIRNVSGGWGKIKEQERAEIVKENSPPVVGVPDNTPEGDNVSQPGG
jgi:rhodanese-related sulfurtransferase